MNEMHHKNLVDLVISQAKKYGDKPLYRFLDQNNQVKSSISFAQLDLLARQWAGLLGSKGGAPGERALLLMGHEANYITAFWGCLNAGVIAVPVFPPKTNKQNELERLIAIVEDCRPTTILTTENFIATAEAIQASLPKQKIAILLDSQLSQLQESSAQLSDCFSPTPDSLAFLQYTSGSTGTPKGVMVDHSNLMANEAAIAEQFRASADDVLFSWLPFYHDMGLIGGIIQPLYSGISTVLMSPMQFIQNPINWLRGLSQYKATVIVGPNFAYDYCCEKINNADIQEIDLSNVRIAVNGAEPVNPATMARFVNYFWQTGLRKDVFSPSYGLAETTLLVSCLQAEKPLTLIEVSQDALQNNRIAEPKDHQDTLRLAGNGPVIEDHDVAIVDPQTQSRCEDNRVGEVWVCGPSVTRGYWQKHELNKTSFGLKINNSDQSFVRTGDYGFIRNGELFITGREKELIIIRGRNYYPQDLEKAIESQVSDIQPARIAAFAVSGSEESESEADRPERLVIVAEPSRQGIKRKNFMTIAQQCALALSSTTGIMADEIIISKLGTITKTSSGKTQRTRCKSKYLTNDIERYATLARKEPSLSLDLSQSLNEADDLDIDTVEGCSEFLKQQITAIAGIDSSLLDESLPLMALGLDSLHIIELIKALKFTIGANVNIEQLLSDATIDSLAGEIVNSQKNAEPVNNSPTLPSLSTAAEAINTPVEQSFQQQRLWFLDQLTPGNSSHNIVIDVTFGHSIDPERLRESLNTMAERHNILRTTFSADDGKPLQLIADTMPLDFIVLATENATIEQHCTSLKKHVFDLNKGPLWKTQLVPVPDCESHLLLAFHHIVFDGVSADIFCRELASLYAGDQSLTALQYHYRDYAQWQQQQFEQGQWDGQLNYWRKQLNQSSPVGLAETGLKDAQPSNTADQSSINTIPFTLSKDEKIAIKRFARQHQLTPFMVYLGAFYIALHYQTGETDLTVGTDTANRPLYEWQHQIGFFVNQLALRLKVNTEQSIDEFYALLRQQTLDAYQHQSFPFDQLVSAINPDRQGNKTPFFSTKLVWQRLELGSQQSALAIRDIQIHQHASEFDVVLDFVESNRGFNAAFKFNPKIVPLASVEKFSALYSLALDTLICNSRLSINQVKQRLIQADIAQLQKQATQQKDVKKIRRRRTGVTI